MGIISGLGSFRGQFGDHFRVRDPFRVRDHFGVGIISGAVQVQDAMISDVIIYPETDISRTDVGLCMAM